MNKIDAIVFATNFDPFVVLLFRTHQKIIDRCNFTIIYTFKSNTLIDHIIHVNESGSFTRSVCLLPTREEELSANHFHGRIISSYTMRTMSNFTTFICFPISEWRQMFDAFVHVNNIYI